MRMREKNTMLKQLGLTEPRIIYSTDNDLNPLTPPVLLPEHCDPNFLLFFAEGPNSLLLSAFCWDFIIYSVPPRGEEYAGDKEQSKPGRRGKGVRNRSLFQNIPYAHLPSTPALGPAIKECRMVSKVFRYNPPPERWGCSLDEARCFLLFFFFFLWERYGDVGLWKVGGSDNSLPLFSF